MQKESRKGVLYGVGVGPGDPELMTLKAVRVIEEADLIVLPAKNRENCYAYRIAKETVPEIAGKMILCKEFPMIKDRKRLYEVMDGIYEELAVYLLKGQNVALLTIGDPSVYSTYMAIHRRAAADGFGTEMISGVTSFCAVAARLGIPLGEGGEQIHILPGTYDIEQTRHMPGTRIYMKSGSKLSELKKFLAEESKEHALTIYSVSNCGLENEQVSVGLEQMDTDSGYLTVVIVKEEKNKRQ